MALAHNLLTNQSEPVATLGPHHIFLFPHEDPQDLVDIQTNWTATYPSSQFVIQTLRFDLIRADFARQRAAALCQTLQMELDETGLPQGHWDLFTLRHLHFFEKRSTQTQHEFHKTLQFLHTFKAPPEPKAPEPPPRPVKRFDARPRFTQFVKVTIQDGKIHTRVEPTTEFYYERNLGPLSNGCERHYCFNDAVIPEPYQFVNHHAGKLYSPTNDVFIQYTNEEFDRITAREKDSPYHLDGTRTGYWRTHDKEPIGTVPTTETPA